jgi:hypothetical protein
VRVLAFAQQMLREFADVDVAVALLAKDQHFAIADVMLALVRILLGAVRAFTRLLVGVLVVNFDLFIVDVLLQLAGAGRFLEN